MLITESMTPDEMQKRLEEAYPSSKISVVDLTGTADHYLVEIESTAFKGMSRIQTHQHVMGVFDKELKTGEVHALTIKATLILE